MGQNATTIECEQLQSYEYNIFDKSFALIQKYIEGDTTGIRDAFNREYEWNHVNEGDGDLNWHKIMPRHLQGSYGSAYIPAIQIVGVLLKEAEAVSGQSDDRFKDKPKFREIYRLVDQLYDLREREVRPEIQCFCLTLKKGYDFQNHEFIMKAWDEFRRGHD